MASRGSRIPSLYFMQFRTEFKMIIGMDTDVSIYSLMEDWTCWKDRIIAYSELEKTHRPKLRTLLSKLKSSSENEGKINNYCCILEKTLLNLDLTTFQLMSELLIPKTKPDRLVHFAKVRYLQ